MMPDTQPSMVLTNSQFLRQLASAAPNGATLWVTSFCGSPDLTDARNWYGRPYNTATMAAQVDNWTAENTYFSVAALAPTADGELRRRKANFVRLLALVADDVELADIQGRVSYVLQTSPGKRQVGILIDGTDADAANRDLVDRLVTTMAERGLLRADASGNNSVRYVRLPVGENQKPRASGVCAHQMLSWDPSVVMTLADAAAAFGVDLDAARHEVRAAPASQGTGRQDELLRMLTSNIVRGERLHESINEMAASLVATGMPGGAVVNTIRGLMESSIGTRDERWLARFQDIPRSVSTAAEKFERPTIALVPKTSGQFKLAPAAVDFSVLEPVDWVLTGYLAAGEVVVFAGQPGVGKSTTFAPLAVLVAGFGEVLGSDIGVDEPRRVLIVSEHAEQYARLMYGFSKRFSIPAQALKEQITIFNAARLTAREIGPEMLELMRRAGGSIPPLVVLDTASASFDLKDENSNAEVGAMLAELKQPVIATGAPLWVIAHAAKALGREDSEITPRGASAYIGDVHGTGSVFRDKTVPDSNFIKSLKNRNEREFAEIEVRTELGWFETRTRRGKTQHIGIRTGVPMKATDSRSKAAEEVRQGADMAEGLMRSNRAKGVALQGAMVSLLLSAPHKTLRAGEIADALVPQGFGKSSIYRSIDQLTEQGVLTKAMGRVHLNGQGVVQKGSKEGS